MDKGRIIVVGSSNMDMVVKTNHIPVPGETVLGGEFFMNPGGKGANQAVAVARLNADVAFVSKIGDDIFGKQSMQLFEEEGIDIQGMVSDENGPSGVALITVDKDGENSIVVAPGANGKLMPEEVIPTLNKIDNISILLMQLEIPMNTVREVAEYGRSNNITVVVNPAPMHGDLAEMLPLIDIITPNAKEAEMLAGIPVVDVESAKEAALLIYESGVKKVVVTIGRHGALIVDNGEVIHVPATEVETVDTTAAGDSFNGALVVGLSEGKTLLEAVQFACAAAAITVTRLGAQSAMPYRNELIDNLLDI
ncbi:ribokinase [Membranihabitans marinus]|uniref:ribokinase n=1 Tax=Membranihabitans marinus TaxID=1227546 RepID=UPI001EFF7EC7|nr:ribokinase [Membranihabitans marinus]